VGASHLSSPVPSAPISGPASAPGLQATYVRIVKTVLPSVVQISTPAGLGSGVVFDNKGDIVTNAHVVGDYTSFTVRFANRATVVKAELVGTYAPDDLAVIKVTEGDVTMRPAKFGDSSALKVGDIVLAMGNPLGLSASVTDGIVSALGRTVTEPQGQHSPGATLPNVIQTSAAINPGNSGGALVDIHGDVVGIPTLAAVDPEMGGAAPGIGFAIPSDIVRDIAGQIVEHGHVVDSHRAALGVRVTTVVDAQGDPVGVGIVDVETGSPAAKAGLKAGEIINALHDTKTPSTQALAVVLAQLRPGQQVAVAVTGQDGKTRTVTVTLGQLPG
jgi:putative serine protease PepD